MFVDVSPGSPESPEAPADHIFPVTQTSASVQLDQVLTTLQSGVRRNLQIFLKEFGNALIKYGGAEGLRQLYQTSPGAYKYTSLVNQAFLGTQPHDLSNLIRNLDSTVQALDADETGLQNLVTNLRVVTGSFAAQNQALSDAIARLPRLLEVGRPALAALDQSFPPLRAFAREALPGVRSTPETLDAATPLLNQIRSLVSKPELRGLSQDLRPHDPQSDQALAPHDPLPGPVAGARELLQPDDHPLVELERPGHQLPAADRHRRCRDAPGDRGRGDGLRPRRDRRREPLRRRQRRVHPGRGRRRREHARDPRAAAAGPSAR